MFNISREDIAEAVTGTHGGLKVTGYGKRPNTLKSGDSWPQVRSIERGPGDAFLVEWTIWVVLSADETTAINQVPVVLPDLVEAIEDGGAGYVDNAVPASFQTSAGELFALQINVRSE